MLAEGSTRARSYSLAVLAEGVEIAVHVERTATNVRIMVVDHGIGVFRTVREAYGLEDVTSRMFDSFVLRSGDLALVCRNGGQDWRLDTREIGQTPHHGTLVDMEIRPSSQRTSKKVCDAFTSGSGTPGFSRTHVPIALARQESDQLISRSQARRILMNVEKFAEVVLDFAGVTTVGQAFADEMFRVWPRANPGIRITTVSVADEVERMIRHVLADAAAAAGERSVRSEILSVQDAAESLGPPTSAQRRWSGAHGTR